MLTDEKVEMSGTIVSHATEGGFASTNNSGKSVSGVWIIFRLLFSWNTPFSLKGVIMCQGGVQAVPRHFHMHSQPIQTRLQGVHGHFDLPP